MKHLKQYERYILDYEDIITVKVKPNKEHKSKWYYGWFNKTNNLAGKVITVTKSGNPSFDNSYCYDDSHYIDIDDCELIGVNLHKYNL